MSQSCTPLTVHALALVAGGALGLAGGLPLGEAAVVEGAAAAEAGRVEGGEGLEAVDAAQLALDAVAAVAGARGAAGGPGGAEGVRVRVVLEGLELELAVGAPRADNTGSR